MYRIGRDIYFSYGHRLAAHGGKCANLHGHNARVTIELSTEKLDAQGMVMDFFKVKETIGAWIRETIDHKMILWKGDPLVPVLEKAGEPLVLTESHPTAETLARWIFDQARHLRLPVARVTLWETENSFAVYHE